MDTLRLRFRRPSHSDYFDIRYTYVIVVHMAAGLAPPDEGQNLNSRSGRTERSPQQKRRLWRGSEGSTTRLPLAV